MASHTPSQPVPTITHSGVRDSPGGQQKSPTKSARWLATLKDVCLDDTVVGVRSVGADGSRSRVVTPPEPDRFDQRPRAAAGGTEAGR